MVFGPQYACSLASKRLLLLKTGIEPTDETKKKKNYGVLPRKTQQNTALPREIWVPRQLTDGLSEKSCYRLLEEERSWSGSSPHLSKKLREEQGERGTLTGQEGRIKSKKKKPQR